MSVDAVVDVLTAVVSHREPASWAASEARIAADRLAIEHFVAAGGRAYGFTTRLGQYDAVEARSADREFLDDHLVGWSFEVPDPFVRLLSAVKASQLAQGGSGIDPDLYRVIRSSAVARDGSAVSGAWLDSYGAADVVPGAWWLRAVLERSRASLRPGDFIASASGSFVSTAAGIAALLQADDVLARFFSFLPATDPALWRTARTPRERAVQELLNGAHDDGDVQAPISLRDATPIVSGLLSASDRLVDALARRLEHPSANPLVIPGPPVRVVSQNSYLDVELTTAAHGMLQVLHLLIEHTQRLCEHAFASDRSPARVQLPKVAQAVVERSRVLLGAPSFSSSQSDGVEDVYDMSLDAAVRVVVMAGFADRALALLGDLRAPRRDVREAADALALGGDEARPDDAMRGAWADALSSGWAGVGSSSQPRW